MEQLYWREKDCSEEKAFQLLSILAPGAPNGWRRQKGRSPQKQLRAIEICRIAYEASQREGGFSALEAHHLWLEAGSKVLQRRVDRPAGTEMRPIIQVSWQRESDQIVVILVADLGNMDNQLREERLAANKAGRTGSQVHIDELFDKLACLIRKFCPESDAVQGRNV